MAETSATQSGKEIQICAKENGKLILDQEALERVICQPSIGKRPISIVAIVGALRKGKSFLLNFFLRYLRNNGYENENWMGKPEDTIDEGFTWRGGKEGVTSGITIWSEPFIINRRGKEIAILLMDTQGAFDNSSNISECMQIFTISLIMSSLVIFNVHSQIQEDNLQYLEYFMMYSQRVKEKARKSPPQALMFLVRDWVHGVELGLTGGKELMSGIASRKESSMSSIKKTFGNDLHCYLLPFPGENVLMPTKGTIRITEINEKFLKYVGELCKTLFDPSSKLLKRNKSRGRNLVNIVISSWKVFLKLPQPSNVKELASKNLAMACQSDAENEYDAFLRKLTEETTSIKKFEELSIDELSEVLETYRAEVSTCSKSDSEAGAQTLHAKLQQKHNQNLVLIQLSQGNERGGKLIRKKDFESSYLDKFEKILCGDDAEKLSILDIVYGSKEVIMRGEFSDLTENEIKKIEKDMKDCFDVYKDRITLNERLKSARKCQDNSTDIREFLEDSIEDFEFLVKESEFDAEFGKALTDLANTCSERGELRSDSIDQVMVKIDILVNMVILEGDTMEKLHDLSEKVKRGHVKIDDLEKDFTEIKKKFQKSSARQTETNKQGVKKAPPSFLTDRHFEREFNFAKKIYEKQRKYAKAVLKTQVLEAKWKYMAYIHQICDSAYVSVECLEEEDRKAQKTLCAALDQVYKELPAATESIPDYKKILKDDLSNIFQEFKESNEKNKTFFHKTVIFLGEVLKYIPPLSKASSAFMEYAGKMSHEVQMTFITAKERWFKKEYDEATGCQN